MIVGFTITDFLGHEAEAVEFIKRVCILESPDVAKNIVAAGTGINIFSKAVTLEELQSQPFKSTPIETVPGKYLLVSIVNFNLELLYNSRILRLSPAEYINVLPGEVAQFEEYISQGIVRTIPEIVKDGQTWILSDGIWDDTGIWVDSDFWRDEK